MDLLTTAIALHEAGDFRPAAALYARLLRSEPNNATALHLLGVLNHQQGDHIGALKLIDLAVRLQPDAPEMHANLAEVHRASGRFEEAISCCRTALRLAPDLAEARNNLALALQANGELDAAAAELRRLVELNPHSAAAHNNLGTVLREQGCLNEAKAEFVAALQCDPGFAAAQCNLGQLLLDCGRNSEGLARCEEAARQNPDHAASRHALGNALRAAGRDVDALKEYQMAAHLAPKLSEPPAQAGLILQAQGKFDRALWWLERAARLDSGNPVAWRRLAELQERRDDFPRASAAWGRAVALAPRQADLRVGWGWAMQEQGRLNDAAEQFRTALGIDPQWAPAHLNLGGLHEELGELVAAEAEYRKAIAADPRFAIPHGRLATLLRGTLPEQDLTALNQCLGDAELPDEPRCQLLFALSQVLDARREYEAAAANSRSANALRQACSIRQFREYSCVEHSRLVDRLIAGFTPELFRRLQGAGSSTARLVFVFGLPRSGTTLVEQVLSSHSAVFGAGELRFAQNNFARMTRMSALSAERPPFLASLTPESVRRAANRYLTDLDSLDGSRPARIVDKMPENYLYLGLLAVLFPKATFIHCRRDLRDCALSCWMTDFRSITWASDAANIGSRFWDYRRLMQHWESVLPATIHPVDYEQIVADLDSVARHLVAACGLEWEPRCLEFHRNVRPVRTASLTQVRRPIYTSSVNRWKNYEHLLPELFDGLPELAPTS